MNQLEQGSVCIWISLLHLRSWDPDLYLDWALKWSGRGFILHNGFCCRLLVSRILPTLSHAVFGSPDPLSVSWFCFMLYLINILFTALPWRTRQRQTVLFLKPSHAGMMNKVAIKLDELSFEWNPTWRPSLCTVKINISETNYRLFKFTIITGFCVFTGVLQLN